MREMVFNHASARIAGQRRDTLYAWLKDIAVGMSRLVHDGVVRKSLRSHRDLYTIQCFQDCTLWDAFLALRKAGCRDEFAFLSGLASRAPLTVDIEESIKDRFLSTESKRISGTDEEPLILCAIADWIAVSIPSSPSWDCDRLQVHFRELLPNESMEECSEMVDQLSRPDHAKLILDRHVSRIRLGCENPSALWQRRREAFPNLLFGPDVEHNLVSCAQHLTTIVGKLIDLDEASRDWRERGGSAPHWKTKVSPESTNSMKNPKFVKSRTFRSSTGTLEIFEWHARFGNSGRIHLRFGAHSHEVEIGYIGPHLPISF